MKTCKIETITIKTDERLVNLARQLKGWSFDINGCLFTIINNKLFTLFINSDTDELDITVEEMDKNGQFEVCLEWWTLSDENDFQTIYTFINQYK